MYFYKVLSDVLLIQSALSKKVGNYIHNMATFFSGLVVGFLNCWQIALITLATGPFIVATGGISNIFLHRLLKWQTAIKKAFDLSGFDSSSYNAEAALIQGVVEPCYPKEHNQLLRREKNYLWRQ